MFSLGIDLGSTTIKYVLLDENGDVVGKDYLRHQSAVGATLIRGLKELSYCPLLTGGRCAWR